MNWIGKVVHKLPALTRPLAYVAASGFCLLVGMALHGMGVSAQAAAEVSLVGGLCSLIAMGTFQAKLARTTAICLAAGGLILCAGQLVYGS